MPPKPEGMSMLDYIREWAMLTRGEKLEAFRQKYFLDSKGEQQPGNHQHSGLG